MNRSWCLGNGIDLTSLVQSITNEIACTPFVSSELDTAIDRNTICLTVGAHLNIWYKYFMHTQVLGSLAWLEQKADVVVPCLLNMQGESRARISLDNFYLLPHRGNVEIKLAVFTGHSIPTPGQPDLVPTLERQTCGRIDARIRTLNHCYDSTGKQPPCFP